MGCYVCLRTILSTPGLNATLATERGENVFHFAAKRGDNEMIRIVRDHLATDQARKDMPGQELDIFKLLTQAAVDDKTPLGFAQLHKQSETVLFLQQLISTRSGRPGMSRRWEDCMHHHSPCLHATDTPNSTVSTTFLSPSPTSHSSNGPSPGDATVTMDVSPELLTEEDFVRFARRHPCDGRPSPACVACRQSCPRQRPPSSAANSVVGSTCASADPSSDRKSTSWMNR